MVFNPITCPLGLLSKQFSKYLNKYSQREVLFSWDHHSCLTGYPCKTQPCEGRNRRSSFQVKKHVLPHAYSFPSLYPPQSRKLEKKGKEEGR